MDDREHSSGEAALLKPRGLDRLFDGARKKTVIELRWPLVLLCSYLLLYSAGARLSAEHVHALIGFYLLTNVTLYFVAEELFDSPRFYGPLLLFDTLFFIAVFGFGGGVPPDFFVAGFFTIILSCICRDSRGLLLITFLAPLLYGYAVFNSVASWQPNESLRLFFPFVIALFYGYFAQVERLKGVARENAAQARRHLAAAQENRRQRERLEMLHEINAAVSATLLDRARVLDVFLEKTLNHFPFGAAIVRLRNHETGVLETAAVRGMGPHELLGSADPTAWADRVAEVQEPLVMRHALQDDHAENAPAGSAGGAVSFLGLPLSANGERLGSLAFLTREEHDFSAEDIEFLSTMAGQAALAIRHAELFERIQEQANALRLVSQVKDEFLGIVSHELKTPLNVISGYINILTDGIFGDLSPIQEQALETILRQTKELNGLINRVLQVCNLETETPRVDLQKINFWEFLYELKSMYEYPMPKEIKLHWEFSSDLPTLYSDRGKLKNIIENLVNNAVKFTDAGSVTIAARFLPDKKMMEFKIADTGVGISKEQLATIFDRFRQVDSSGTRAYAGMGLGLYIVKRYTQLLGGTIHVESNPGRGSVFTLQIPCQSEQPPASPPDGTLPQAFQAGSERLL